MGSRIDDVLLIARGKMVYSTKLINLLIVISISMAGLAMGKSNNSTFESSVEQFLAAVATKDFEKFKKHLRPDAELRAVLPAGDLYEGYDSFLESQRNWFSQPGGEFRYEIDLLRERGKMGLAGVFVTYSNRDERGEYFSKRIYISFVFELDDKGWFLIHDQNTLLRE